MKRDLMSMALDLGQELIIDNFAGGGGTSTGLEWAFGRPVDIAINHDPEALAMHAANHPQTKHLCESVWDVDPIKVTNNQPVGLVWLSPDCKHFSKAKGGKPVEKRIRGLAWVTMRWAAKCKPRVIMLENVEEFKTWGPLLVDADGNAKPDPAKKGKTFESFIRQLRGHGYDVEYQELRANDHDTPTIRKRFFLVARRDGLPIRWPAPTHAAPKTISVQAGKLKPYRTAAECIDWSIPCQSIFNRKKPLAEATLRRIAKGIMRYVVDAAEPFIVGQGGPIYSGKPKSTAEPFGTLTTENHRAVVLPTIVPVTHQGGDRSESINDPFRTITGAQRGEKALATATLSAVLVDAAHGEVSPGGVKRWGSGAHKIDAPIGTVLASGNKALVTAFLAKHYTGVVGSDLDDPLGTVTSSDHHSLVTAHIQRDMGQSVGHAADAPLGTITAGGGKSALVASSLVKLRGTSTAAGMDEPLGTISAGGQHHAEVRAFLLKYYGSDQDPRLEDPMHTVTSKDRFGLVTIHGQDYQIVDIGLRMLAPRELFRAQGFPDSYIIDSVPDWERLFVDGEQVADVKSIPWRPLTKSSQVRMCGNS
ncbi:MAG: DNA cytosine methyltransferase, partial [Burkholderiaceae bacterium]|nr:DNA cytosine methyltransferase [Burkholderiaceae bacterium]